MKILYIIKSETTETLEKFIEVHKGNNEVKVINVDDSTSPDELLNEIESADKIISW